MNKTAKGNYYRNRTKKWLEDLGYSVEPLERSLRVVTRDPKSGVAKVIFRRLDIWGADLVARNEDDLLFIQVKASQGDISKGIKELSRGAWPRWVSRWVVWWPPRRRLALGPEITEVSDGL